MSFETLGLRDDLMRAIAEMGFTDPMPIQERSIPALLAPGGADLVGLAQTGTGKTGAFGLPLLQLVDPACKQPQGIILCPTRELCMQIVKELRQFGRHIKGLRVAAVYGGASISAQVTELRRGAQVVVATPGRMLDLMQRGAIKLEIARVAVLDEADEMLDMGFQEDMNLILKALPEDAHYWMFSATMSPGVAAIARKYLKDPVEITIGTRNQAADNLTHQVCFVHPSHRYAAFKRIVDTTPEMYGLIFRRTRRDTQELAEMLARDGYAAEPLHGDLTQAQRDSVMRRFRQRQVRLLIATDVAARGIDVDDITHIFHYDLPDEIENYTHRSGRTARAGKSGASIVFVAPAEQHRVRQMEHRLKLRFTPMTVPDGADVRRLRLRAMAQTLADAPTDDKALAKMLPTVEEVLEGLSREEIVKRLTALELRRLKGSHISAQDLNADVEAERPARGSRQRRAGPPPRMQVLEIDAGRADNINEGAIVRIVCEAGAVQSSNIGGIRMRDRSTLFEVGVDVVEQVQEGLKQALLDGRPVRVRTAKHLPTAPTGAHRHMTSPAYKPRPGRGVPRRRHGKE